MLWSSLLGTGLKMFLKLHQQKADSRGKWEAFLLSSFAHMRDRMKYQWLQVELLIFISRGMEMVGWSPHSGTKQHLWISPFTPRIQSRILVDSGRYSAKPDRNEISWHLLWLLNVKNLEHVQQECFGNVHTCYYLCFFLLFPCGFALLYVTLGEAAPQQWLHSASDPFLHRAGAHFVVLFW